MEGVNLEVMRSFADSDHALTTALVTARWRMAAAKPDLSRASSALPPPKKTPVRPPSPLRRTKTFGEWNS